MPVEVEVAGQRHAVAMTGGQGEIRVPPGSHVIVDPDNRVLRQLDFIDRFQTARR
jgi:predicted amidohydrolase